MTHPEIGLSHKKALLSLYRSYLIYIARNYLGRRKNITGQNF